MLRINGIDKVKISTLKQGDCFRDSNGKYYQLTQHTFIDGTGKMIPAYDFGYHKIILFNDIGVIPVILCLKEGKTDASD